MTWKKMCFSYNNTVFATKLNPLTHEMKYLDGHDIFVDVALTVSIQVNEQRLY